MKRKAPIAVVAIGGLFPDAPTLDDFWANILAGHHASREVPADRWLLPPDAVFSSERGAADRVYSRRACLLDDAWLDASRLEPCALDTAMLQKLDPMFRLLLRVGQQTWRQAAQPEHVRQRSGIIIGNLALPSEASSALTRQVLERTIEEQLFGSTTAIDFDPYNLHVAGLPATLLARALGLGGPCTTLDAACASSLYAIKLAMDALHDGRADVMLAGGLSRPDSLYTQMGFCQLQALSASGIAAPFARRGDGLVVGEGCGLFVLKRLADAERDGDTIHALIHAVGLSNDRDGGLLAPESEGQLRAMRSAYRQAGWSPSDVAMIECHAPGTPVGDVIEFRSMQQLWQEQAWQPGQCVIGSVKSNIGHLLTAAGAAALSKAILAIQHGVLPPTANFDQAAAGITMQESPFRLLQQAEAWPDHGKPRRAAVSAFGFGGINAHVLIEAYQPGLYHDDGIAANNEPLAIVGMAARLGSWNDVDAVVQGLATASESAHDALSYDWGASHCRWFADAVAGRDALAVHRMDEVTTGITDYRIPPHEKAEMLPRQMLMLNLAAAALNESGGDEHQTTGVFIGAGLDVQACNFSARWGMAPAAERWAAQLGLTLDDAAMAAWVDELRQSITPPLNAGRTMGALGSTVASRIAKAFRTAGPAFTLSAEDQSAWYALDVACRALQHGEVDRALVGAVEMAADVRWLLSRLAATNDATPHIPLADGGAALVLKRLSDARRDGNTIYAVIRATASGESEDGTRRQACRDSACDESGLTPWSAREQRGVDAGSATGMMPLVQAVSALYRRLTLSTPPLAYIADDAAAPRRILLTDRGCDGGHNHTVLEAYRASCPPVAQPALPLSATLILLCADDVPALLESIAKMRHQLVHAADASLPELARLWYRADDHRPCRLALVADHPSMLLQQLDFAAQSLREQPHAPLGVHGSTPQLAAHIQDRVFYSPQPLAREGKIAFVFAGSGNHFPTMGRDLLRHWPGIMAAQEQHSAQLAAQYLPQRVWQSTFDDDFYEDHNALVISHVALGTAICDGLRSFGLQPQMAMGYSLGESTSLFSLGVWRERDAMMQRLSESPLFTEQLAGACTAARQQWQLPDGEAIDWVIGIIHATADAVRALLPRFPRAYLLIINTARECVIGGQREQVMDLTRLLQVHMLPLRGVTTVHCDVVTPVADAYRSLHLFDTHSVPGVTFYGFASGEPYTPTRETAADAILNQAMHTVDFSRVVERAYRDGARLFFEIGPGQSCSRMIRSILGERRHLARSSCYAGEAGDALLLRTLAHAVAEGVTLDLSPLYPSRTADNAAPTIAASRVGTTITVKRPVAAPRIPRHEPVATVAPVVTTPPTVTDTSTMTKPHTTPATPDWSEPLRAVMAAKAEAHARYLQFAATMSEVMAQAISQPLLAPESVMPPAITPPPADEPLIVPTTPPRSLNRAQCMEFAIGSIGRVLGERFAEVDAHPTRVRLPDEPLMLVDRILLIEGEPCSMTHGRVVTEHDVTADRWYLDGGHIPTCVAVEAGQADLFLSGYLGIDFITRGKAVYRLLDAVVTFHDSLPQVGDVIHYDIYIDEFFRQGETWLFRFHFESTVNGKPLMSMQKGCAGFFSDAELAAGQGIIHSTLDQRPQQGTLPDDWRSPLPLREEQWDDTQIAALYAGDLGRCFGAPFDRLPFTPYTLPPQSHLRLVDRVIGVEPQGGRYGIGRIRAEMDIQPQDWFLTCHFVDDQVMPGTLMYECCMHTLRIFLLRMGWVGAEGETWCEPLPGIDSGLKCRGQVLASTRVVTYQVDIKTLGYNPEPFVIVDALMFADGKPIVEISTMSARLRGLSRPAVEALWQQGDTPQPAPSRQVLYTTEQITAFAIGKPSIAFGDRYRIFDQQRKIARLPGPPFQFLDRIMDVQGEPWVMQAGASVEAAYDVPPDAWYFAADRQSTMPFSVLLETGLQPCGWLAAYVGSALTSETDLSFRNLDGNAVQYRAVDAHSGTLTTHATLTRVSSSGGMIIQAFDYRISDRHGVVYAGDTVFGFFSQASLAQQIGVRGASLYTVSEAERARAQSFAYPTQAPYPDAKLRMIDRIEAFIPDGGTHGLGFIRGTKQVNPEEWFFKAHFYQDPVCPGSLGLESFLQLLKVVAMERWGADASTAFECVALGANHRWNYRGQIIPSNHQVSVEAVITAIDNQQRMVTADGYLSVDGKTIYQMFDFTVKLLR